MPSASLKPIKVANIDSFKTVLTQLYQLNEQLPNSQLSQFVLFNDAYRIVTETIGQACTDGYFKKPEFIKQFSVIFARYYFQAINVALSKRPNPAVAWEKMSQTRSSPAFIPLLMGANAHINRDLPLALLEFVDGQKVNDLVAEIIKVDKLLMKSGKEIVGSFREPKPSLDFIKRRLRSLYYRPIMYLILGWRIVAWRKYKAIKRQRQTKSSCDSSGLRNANFFLKLGKYLG